MLHTIKISAKDKEYKLQFKPVAYCDWFLISSEVNRVDSNVIRYIFEKYVNYIYINKDISDIDTLINDHHFIIEPIMNSIETKSNFSDETVLKDTLKRNKEAANNLFEIYDLFMFQHMDIKTYIDTLDMSFDKRLLIISKLQELTGIDVSDRIKLSETTALKEIDLITPHDKFSEKLKKLGIVNKPNKQENRKVVHNQPPEHNQQPALGGSLEARAIASKELLLNAIRNERLNPTKIDPVRDEMDYRQSDNTADIDLYNKRIKK